MQKSGFTLVEILVTIIILAIVLAIGVPSFTSLLRSSAMISNSTDIVTSFNYARIEAIKRGTSVQLQPSSGSDWSNGVVVWVDSDKDGALNGDETLRVWDKLSSASTLESANMRTRFVFNAAGEVNIDDQLTLCDDRSGEEGRVISVLLSGAVFAEKVRCG